MKNRWNFLLVFILGLGVGLAFNLAKVKSFSLNTTRQVKNIDGRIDGYNFLGTEFAYYKIPANLSREELIVTAKKLHELEPDANLVLVDDDSKVRHYIKFAQLVNPGYNDVEMPRDWAEKHIVANVQRHTNGKIVLCEGYGYKQIAELK